MTLHDDDDVELTAEQKAELDRQIDAFLAGITADDSPYLTHIASRIQADMTPTTWRPVDLAAALDEARTGVESPALLCRTDNRHLIYEGRTHSLAGEPESGKSWLALLAVAQAITNGQRCLWIDYEDSASGILGRLDALAIPEATILGGLFAYIRPEEPLADKNGRGTPAIFDFDEVLRTRWDLVVIDGVTEAMVVEGFDVNSNADVAAWQRRIVKRFTSEGAAVLLLDHLTKSQGEYGPSRFAIGAQHKLAGLTGAGYRLDNITPFRRAAGTEPAHGLARVVVTKDRPGHVRGIATDSVVGVLKFTAWPDGRVSLDLEPLGEGSPLGVAPLDRRLVRAIIEYLLTYDGSTARAITSAVPGHAEKLRETVRRMVEMGLLRVEKTGTGHYHYLTEAGRAWIDDSAPGDDDSGPSDDDGGPGDPGGPSDDPVSPLDF